MTEPRDLTGYLDDLESDGDVHFNPSRVRFAERVLEGLRKETAEAVRAVCARDAEQNENALIEELLRAMEKANPGAKFDRAKIAEYVAKARKDMEIPF